MKQTKHSSQKSKTRTRLFTYTEDEEIRIERAKRDAELYFMQSYGKGRKPRMLDPTNYL